MYECDGCGLDYEYNKHSMIPELCRKCIEKTLIDIKHSNRKICNKKECKQCYYNSFETCERTKEWSDKNVKKPRDISMKSSRRHCYFNCKCGHELYLTLNKAYRGQCKYCSHRELCDDEDCRFCFENSFASCEEAQYWSEKNKLKPRQVFKSANSKFWFDHSCDHEIEVYLQNIMKGSFCGYCSDHPVRLCEKRECKMCSDRSFASHEKAKYWSEKNDVSPRDIFLNDTDKYLFDCICGHEICMRPNDVVCGYWCCYCAHIKLCNNNDCKMCFENSFASHERSKYWSKKNKVKPREVFKSSHTSYYFDAPCGHEVFVSPNRSTWCNRCNNKTEGIIYDFLVSQEIDVKKEVKFSWCKNINHLPFDFLVDKIIIELDGSQHFEDNDFWGSSFDENSDRDVFKMKCALENGYSIIRLVQEEVWKDKFDWRSRLINSLKVVRDKPNVVYITEDETIYENHKQKLNFNEEYLIIPLEKLDINN